DRPVAIARLLHTLDGAQHVFARGRQVDNQRAGTLRLRLGGNDAALRQQLVVRILRLLVDRRDYGPGAETDGRRALLVQYPGDRAGRERYGKNVARAFHKVE